MKKGKLKFIIVGAALIWAAVLTLGNNEVPNAKKDASVECKTVLSGSETSAHTIETTVPVVDESHVIAGVPHIYQGEAYPTGCESAAAAALLNYYGYDITVGEFIDRYLPQTDRPVDGGDGNLYGESPYEYFIGDPRSQNGFGCYAPVIEKAMNEYLDGTGAAACIVENADMEALAKKYVSVDVPVLIWATMYMDTPQAGKSWILPNGESFTFMRPEHALLLIGYDDDSYYFSDSLSESEITVYSRSDCLEAFDAQGCQAIVLKKSR